MHKIDGAGHVNNTWVAEDALNNQPPTEVTADWMNAVQEEIANAITDDGTMLNKPNNSQLLQMVKKSSRTLIDDDSSGVPDSLITAIEPNLINWNTPHVFFLKAQFANETPTPTLTTSDGESYPIVKGDNKPLLPGDISSRQRLILLFDTSYQAYVLLNPVHGLAVASTTTAAPDVGMISYFPGTVAPTGYLEADGSVIATTVYPELVAALSAPALAGIYTSGLGAGFARLPDLRGVFIRGWDHGADIDSDFNRAVGSLQQDAFKSHAHGYLHTAYTGIAQVDGLDRASLYYQLQAAAITSATGGAETRPINIAMLPCIKYQ